MKCPACRLETGKKKAKYFCPHCGAPLKWAMRWKKARKAAQRQEVREHLAAPSPAKPAPSLPVSGATLTGKPRADFALGLLSEPVGSAMLAWGAWQLLTVRYPLPELWTSAAFLEGITGAFVLWHGAWMRERFPAVAAGWKRWRDTGGVVLEHFLTLLYGAFLLMILMPIGGLLVLILQMFGAGAWIPVLIVVYGFGIVARRIRGDNLAARERLQNG